MSYKRILVPIDYSENSRRAVSAAVVLAQHFGAELELVHVWDRPSYAADVVLASRAGQAERPLTELIQENAQNDMNEFVASIALPSEVKHSERLLAGEPVSALVEELKRGHYDLMILSTHGRTGFTHWLMGSVAEKLLRLSPVPVFVVPARAPA